MTVPSPPCTSALGKVAGQAALPSAPALGVEKRTAFPGGVELAHGHSIEFPEGAIPLLVEVAGGMPGMTKSSCGSGPHRARMKIVDGGS